MSPEIVWVDDWLLVANKPAGVHTQAPDGGGDNLFDALRAGRAYVGLHHRLDAGVSGLVLFTLDPSVNAAVARGFREHTIVRTYLAVAVGDVASGTWTRPIEGAPASTAVTRLGAGAGLTALRLEPHTGRKHQLRIHAALAGTPLAGDRTYGGDAGRSWPRIALHAAALQFVHPVTGAPTRVECPLPPELATLWERASGRPPAGRGPG